MDRTALSPSHTSLDTETPNWASVRLMRRSWDAPVSGEEKVRVAQEQEAFCSAYLATAPIKLPNGRTVVAADLFDLRVRYEEQAVLLEAQASPMRWKAHMGQDQEWLRANAFKLIPSTGRTTMFNRFRTLVELQAARFLPSAQREQFNRDLLAQQMSFEAGGAKIAVVLGWNRHLKAMGIKGNAPAGSDAAFHPHSALSLP